MYDLIIIGAGPAGLSAAIYAVRQKLNLLVLAQTLGGQTIEAHLIENYLGIPGISGVALVEKFREHAKKLNTEIKEGVRVQSIIKADRGFKIITDKGDFETKTIIVATGKRYRRLDIPGAKEFEGRGITYCATCDAPLFKSRVVAVVGAGDAGQDAVWQLTNYASKIYLLNRYSELRGDDVQMQEQIKNHQNIEIINNCYPVEIKGEKFVKGLVYQCNGPSLVQLDQSQKQEILIDGVFVEIGSVPTSEFLNDMVKLNEKREIVIDPRTNMSSSPGIFAAGDVTDAAHKQMIVAAGEGAKAALSAYEYLKTK